MAAVLKSFSCGNVWVGCGSPCSVYGFDDEDSAQRPADLFADGSGESVETWEADLPKTRPPLPPTPPPTPNKNLQPAI